MHLAGFDQRQQRSFCGMARFTRNAAKFAPQGIRDADLELGQARENFPSVEIVAHPALKRTDEPAESVANMAVIDALFPVGKATVEEMGSRRSIAFSGRNENPDNAALPDQLIKLKIRIFWFEPDAVFTGW